MNSLTLVLSGQIVRENSANLMNFWRGFIHIQNAIHNIDELKIVAHSWNPEFDELVKSVYHPDYLESEKQPSFVHEYMPLLNPVNKFEMGLKRFRSTWKKVSYQAILGNARSRTRGIALLNKFNLQENSQILTARWDAGCTGSKEVHTIIFDSSLHPDYLYISYYSEVDEGYADMWFLAPYKYAKHFETYDRYILECLAGNNNFFDFFTKNGWFLALPKNNRLFIFNQYKKAFFNKILRNFPFDICKKSIPFLHNKIEGLQQKLRNIIDIPILSGENSLILDTPTQVYFPNYQALNNHAMLKSFIFNRGIRGHTRLLDIKDFENLPKGQLINPLEFCYVIYSHSSFHDCWEMAIMQAKLNLPKNCNNIYLISEDSTETNEKFSKLNIEGIKLVTYNADIKYTDRLIEIFSKISSENQFCYFVHEDMPLTSNVDAIYLNTLLHYMNNSNEFYIKLVDTTYVDDKQPHDSFPSLVKNMGGYSISVQPALIKLSYMISFLTNFHEDIYGFEQMCIRSNFTFSAVNGSKKIGQYLLVNDKFPHIATAISKGKWLTSEWKPEITHLSEKYNINLSLRGEC